MILMKEEHLKIMRKIKRRAWKIHSILILIILALIGFNYANDWQVSLIKESYSLFKTQYNSIVFKQQLYTLLRGHSLSIDQAMNITDVILNQKKVPISLALAMISVESDFDPDAISSKGAKGLSQIMPIVRETYKNHPAFKDVKQVYDVSINVKLGLTYLGDLYDRFQDWRKALRAYNAGPEHVNNKKIDKYVDAVFYKAKTFERSLKGL